MGWSVDADVCITCECGNYFCFGSFLEDGGEIVVICDECGKYYTADLVVKEKTDDGDQMSKSDLYSYPDSNSAFCARDFAKKHKYSIRKARRILKKMVENLELLYYPKRRIKDIGTIAKQEVPFESLDLPETITLGELETLVRKLYSKLDEK